MSFTLCEKKRDLGHETLMDNGHANLSTRVQGVSFEIRYLAYEIVRDSLTYS